MTAVLDTRTAPDRRAVRAGRPIRNARHGWRRSPAAPARLRVVVVTHESAGSIVRCLTSVLLCPDDVEREIVVVDNASTDGTPELVEKLFPAVRLIRKSDRHGFATNVNIGVEDASAPYLLLLNPDAVVRPGSLTALVSHLDRSPGVGVAGPRLVYPDGRPQCSARRFPSPLTTLVRRTPLRLFFPSAADAHLLTDLPAEPVDVDWMLGAALLVRREALEELGGLDEGYRLYCEDADLCYRLHQSGWGVQHVGGAVFEHELAERTRKRFLTVLTIWHLRSILRFVRKHGLGRPTPAVREPVPVLATAA